MAELSPEGEPAFAEMRIRAHCRIGGGCAGRADQEVDAVPPLRPGLMGLGIPGAERVGMIALACPRSWPAGVTDARQGNFRFCPTHRTETLGPPIPFLAQGRPRDLGWDAWLRLGRMGPQIVSNLQRHSVQFRQVAG